MLTPPDATALARFETGNIVGDLACALFPNGREIPYMEKKFTVMAELTREWMDEGLETIYEATFIHEGIVVMVDVLRVTPDGVEVYEVKSSSEVKDIYLHDVSIQRYVIESLGYTVTNCHVVHIDTSYVRGDALDLSALFSIVEVSEAVDALMSSVPAKLDEFEAHLANRDNEPSIEIGKHCKNPYECDAMHYCWKVQRSIPDYSVFNIFNLGSKNQIELYDQGIVRIEEIPDSYKMTALQRQKVDNWKAQRTHIDRDALGEFLSTLTYPIYHLDFETCQQAVPQWRGISPYQQIPFQYSLHIEHSDGTLEHREFLSPAGADPRYTLAQQLIHDIPDNVTVLAYNMSFERGVIEKLAQSFPDLSDRLKSILPNLRDLMVPFQKGHYVTPSMNGSYSIKYVLPALVPEMEQSYKLLDGVQNGGEAMNAYAKLATMEEEEQVSMRRALLEYCKLDTLAMVRVHQKLKEVLND
ncbi:MAG: phosphomethylpyrimidine kinase [Sulfuricurvum sp. MLSB]|nr:MAG: phosphomethylpyrimidine kinase [Sulfuricurvum sp. MLSB]